MWMRVALVLVCTTIKDMRLEERRFTEDSRKNLRKAICKREFYCCKNGKEDHSSHVLQGFM